MSKLVIFLYVLATSSALIALKFAADTGAPISFEGGKLSFNINAITILGIFLFGTSFLLYTYLISSYDLGYIVPITTALVYIVIFTSSYFLFKESFTILKIGGIVLIIAGLLLLNVGSTNT